MANYIYGRVLQALTAHIHATATSAARIREVEQTARQYIDDAVRLDVDTTAFFGTNGAVFAARWDAGEGQQVIDRLFAESYRVVERPKQRPLIAFDDRLRSAGAALGFLRGHSRISARQGGDVGSRSQRYSR